MLNICLRVNSPLNFRHVPGPTGSAFVLPGLFLASSPTANHQSLTHINLSSCLHIAAQLKKAAAGRRLLAVRVEFGATENCVSFASHRCMDATATIVFSTIPHPQENHSSIPPC